MIDKIKREHLLFLFIHMRILVTLILFAKLLNLGAQASVNGGKLNINTSRLTSIESIQLSDESATGTQLHLTDELQFGTIDLGKMLEIKSHRFRYDVKNNLFELEVDGNLKYLNGFGVKKFTIINTDSSKRQFIPAIQIRNEEEFSGAFFEVLHANEITLFAHHYAQLLPANYIEGLDIGDRSESYSLKTKYYLREDKNQLLEIRKKKDLIRHFGEKGKAIGLFLKENSIALKNRDELIMLAVFINTL